MKCPAVLLLLPLLACAPDAPAALAKRSDAVFTGSVLAVGPANSKLGTFLVPCGDQFLAAGSRGPVWYSGTFTTAPTSSLLAAIACTGPVTNPNPVVGTTSGTPGAWKLGTGVWANIDAQGTAALIRTPDRGLLAAHSGKIVALESDGGVVANLNATALAFHPTSALAGNLVVLDTVAQTVTTLQPLSYATLAAFSPPPGKSFAGALAVGQFHPGSAWQIAVSTVAGEVLIMDPTGAPFMTLKGTTPSFGAALGVSPGYFTSTDGLYVGEPDLDTVHLMVGDAGVELMSIDGGRFGAALAVNPRGDLAIGAPLAGDGGLVFRQNNSGIFPVGDPALCDVGQLCRGTFGCTTGTCVGGIVCAFPTTGCLPGERCVMGMLDVCVPIGDAGVVDAGTVRDAGLADAGPGADAGEPTDAGRADAGSIDGGSIDAGAADAGVDGGSGTDAGERFDGGSATDAGERIDGGALDAGLGRDAGLENADGGPDAGVLIFNTCGCSTGSALPGLMAALLVYARRRPRGRINRSTRDRAGCE